MWNMSALSSVINVRGLNFNLIKTMKSSKVIRMETAGFVITVNVSDNVRIKKKMMSFECFTIGRR